MTRAIPIDRHRTIGVLASQDAGRTTTTERIIAIAEAAEPAYAGRDERAITVTSAATSLDWQGCRLNIVELPGIGRKVDQAAESAVDGIVFVIDAERGVTPEIAAALARITTAGLAALVFVNKLDRIGADLQGLVREIPGGVLLQLPIGAGAGLRGLVDLVAMIGRFWPEAPLDASAETGPVPEEMVAEAHEARAALIEAAGGVASPEGLQAAIRVAVRETRLVPVLCGSAFRNRGVRGLLDAVARYLPAPSDVKRPALSVEGDVMRLGTDEEPFTAVAFRSVGEAGSRLTFVRVISGVAVTGERLLNAVSMRAETIGEMIRIRANHTETVDEARTGDVVALAGLDHTIPGDTLCDPAAPVVLGGYRTRTAA
jgi:elongation factor G